MVSYFYGDDTYAARQVIGDLAVREGASIRFVDQRDLGEQSLDALLGGGTGSLFAAPLFVIRDASHFPRGVQEDLTTVLARGPQAECVVWDRGVPDRRSLVFRRLKKVSREFASPPPSSLVRFLQTEAIARGGTLHSAAGALLVERVGSDKWQLISELEKLLLLSDEVTESMVADAVLPPVEAEIFSTLDALVRGDESGVVRSVMTLLEQGHSEFYLLAMLAYQFRTLLIIRTGLDSGRAIPDLVREGRLKRFVVEKSLPYARRFSRAWLVGVLTRVLACEFAIKRGTVDARTGLLMLVLNVVNSVNTARTVTTVRAVNAVG